MASSRRSYRPLGARACVLLVLAVLTGLVAMHGLGPAAPMPQHERAMSSVSNHGAEMTGPGQQAMHAADSACHPSAYGHDGGRGHLEHADATCVATGISGGPALDALAPSGVAGADSPTDHGVRDGASATERAPPSLSQLQLLRI